MRQREERGEEIIGKRQNDKIQQEHEIRRENERKRRESEREIGRWKGREGQQ